VVVRESDGDLTGAGTDDDIFFSRSAYDGMTWSDPKLLNSNGTGDSGDDQFAYVEGE
jgi:hypothetical protein